MGFFRRLTSKIGQRSRDLQALQVATEDYNHGIAAKESGDFSMAISFFQKAKERLNGDGPEKTRESLQRYSILAASHNHTGLVELDQGKFPDAAIAFDEAIKLRRELYRLFPEERENEVYLGGALCNRGHAAAELAEEGAADFYRESLVVLRQELTCECRYWDEARETWWCSQLEALAHAMGVGWVDLAPQFIDNAMAGLADLRS